MVVREREPAAPGQAVRQRWSLSGLVQGVGFRPFVHRLATALELAGEVWNHPGGVCFEIEGRAAALAEFAQRFDAELPAPARVDHRLVTTIAACAATGFTIRASAEGGQPGAVLPDLAICDACRRELLDPADRRHGYPFLNCTHCGPRFTILRDLPYDRSRTTMAGFGLCDDCAAEYADPGDRRFHAQPTACAVCGPQLALLVPEKRCQEPFSGWGEPSLDSARPGQKEVPDTFSPLAEAVARLRRGEVLAVKGLGGYHLACDAADEAAVARLRERKHREARPLAVMVLDLAAARALGQVGEPEAALLQSPAAPVVLLDRQPEAPLAPSIAPGLPTVGVMLAYTPLHVLLLQQFGGPLVMTSGNLSDEPIAHLDDDARQRLGELADAMLVHNRPIERRCDDSVMMLWQGEPLPVRRSRGYAPAPLRCGPAAHPVVLAVGAHQKNTFCFLRGGEALLSHHIGDLENAAALESFETGIADFRRLFELTPAVVAHDAHPDYLATRYAIELAERDGLATVEVQHHHAHIAACLADNEVDGPVIGLAFDGTGLGPDGTIWGGEVLLADRADYRRVGALRPFRLAGGEAAVKEGWRVACDLAAQADVAYVAAAAGQRQAFVSQMLAHGVRCLETTSAGRLFDGFSALLGIRELSRYEGEGAVALEGVADRDEAGALPFDVVSAPAGLEIDWRPAVVAVLQRLDDGVSVGVLAAQFHRGLAAAAVGLAASIADETGVRTVALSGGCFMNRLLSQRVAEGLNAVGLTMLRHRRVPPNDGGLCLGQAVVAAARLGGT